MIIFAAFVLGVILTGAAGYSARGLVKKLVDIKLTKDNEYLREEVKRLRAQVARLVGVPEPTVEIVPGASIVVEDCIIENRRAA